MKQILTLCMIVKGNKILLGKKKRRLGVGCWNGFGGKLEEGETVTEAAIREVNEEVGIQITEMEHVGILNFKFENDINTMTVYLYKILKYTGDPIETEEMLPKWFGFDEIPFNEMWPDDIVWMPYFLQNKKFEATFLMDKPSSKEIVSKIISHEIKEVPQL